MGYIAELRKQVGSRPLITVGANVLILDGENRILLQRRTENGWWGTVGGLMEPGESLEETARREVHEETGLVVGGLRLLAVFSGAEFYHKYPHGDEVYNVINTYWTREITGSMLPDGIEGVELRYFALDQIPDNVGRDQAAFKLLKEKLARGEL